ncbi:MAG: hypothetical protein M0Z59_08715 [Nitrospiraceae bacterium]|nr:hypothetical protein [Nitrospiraceae bacterium]
MVILVANLLKETVFYDPLGDAAGEKRKEGVRQEKAIAGFQPGWNADIEGRDLFSKERGHVPPPPPTPKEIQAMQKQALPPRPDFSLKGVIDENGKQLAIIEDSKGGRFVVKPGDVVENARLVSVGEKSAVLRWMGEDIDLSMERVKAISR